VLIFIYVAFRFHTWRCRRRDPRGAARPDHRARRLLADLDPFDLAVVAAILAVIGYSLNDTVVVFDRIRERSRRTAAARRRGLDQSINQTLSRTIMTSVTTLIVVVALLLLGGPVLRGFSAALIVGILIGTYSSIYVAGGRARHGPQGRGSVSAVIAALVQGNRMSWHRHLPVDHVTQSKCCRASVR
jgi:preprotein translocase subunit SecF